MENNKKTLLFIFLIVVLIFIFGILFLYKPNNQIDQNLLQNVAMTKEDKINILNNITQKNDLDVKNVDERKKILENIPITETAQNSSEENKKILENLNLSN